jgi:hypothetical protein
MVHQIDRLIKIGKLVLVIQRGFFIIGMWIINILD